MTLTETRPEDVEPAPREETAPTPAGWAVTADHKRLGLAFVAGSLAFLLVGAVLGMVLRLELVSEGVQYVGGNFGRAFSMHATIAAVLFLGPAWIGVSTYVVPLQIGAARLAFPRLHAFSLWLYLFGGALLVAAYVAGPPAGLGITTSSPIPPDPGGGSAANSLWIVSLALVVAAAVLAAADLVLARAQLPQVQAGAEGRVGSGQDDDVHLVVRLHRGQDRRKGPAQLRVEGVAGFGSVQGDGADPVGHLHQDDIVGSVDRFAGAHWAFSSSSGGRKSRSRSARRTRVEATQLPKLPSWRPSCEASSSTDSSSRSSPE